MKETCIGRKKPILHWQTREVVRHLLQVCGTEKRRKKLCAPFNNSLDRATAYTGLPKSALKIIQKKSKKKENNSGGDKKQPGEDNNISFDDFDRSLIHRYIEEFYLMKNLAPNSKLFLASIKEKFKFPWGHSVLRKMLKEMGYTWLKCHNNRKILVEKPQVIFARTEYLQKIQQYRQINRNIVFIDETWFDNDLKYKKFWKNVEADAILTEKNRNRLILIHAGSRSGFLDDTELLFKGAMTNFFFEEWVTDKLIPKLPSNSVVIMDNALYHSAEINKVPSQFSSKTSMLEWLNENKIKCSNDMRKAEILNLIELHKPCEKLYRIDQLLRSHGHEVLRLPAHMCNLNPIELAWTKIHQLVEGLDFKSDVAMQTIKLAITQVTAEDWNSFDDYVKKLEETYIYRDTVIEDTVDRLVIELSDNEDSGSEMSVMFNSDSE